MNLTPTEMVTELNVRLHSPEGGSDRILFWLNEEQGYVEKLRDDWWWLLDVDTDDDPNHITTEESTVEYDLPSDFDRMLSMRDETSDNPLTPRSISWLYRQDATPIEEGPPDHYILLGPTSTSNVWHVKFDLVPADEYIVAFDYYKKLPALDTATNIPSLVPDHALLMLGAEIRGRIDNEEPEDLPILQGNKTLYDQRLRALRRRQDFDRDVDRHIKRDHRLTADGFRWGGR